MVAMDHAFPIKLATGCFVISLDFELAWGTRGRPSASVVGPDLDGARYAIDGLLRLFARYDLSATWVVVGGMFLGGQSRHPWLSGTAYDDVPYGNYRSQPRWYAEDILQQLRTATPVQDIGCHTLTHMFVQDTVESRDQLDSELACSADLFERLNLPPARSFIYPKAYMAHFDLLKKHGIECYRGPETGWFERLPGVHLSAAGRLLWAKLRRPPLVSLPYRNSNELWVIPSSQYYPSFRSIGKYVSIADRTAKAIKGLNAAANQRAVYHLWTHPFNLGQRTDELLVGLESIFKHARKLRDQGHLENHSMASLSIALARNDARENTQGKWQSS